MAYFVSDVVNELDLSTIIKRYKYEDRGYPPYHPVMMVKVLLYAYCIGVPLSRKIAKRLEEEEDRQYGKDKRGDDLPKELAFKESRLKKIQQAGKALETEAKLARKTGKRLPSVLI